MSHSHYRPPALEEPRANSGFYRPSDRLLSGDRGALYQSSREPPSSPHSTTTSYRPSLSRASAATSSPYSSSLDQSDQTLTLLSNCGLEPKDLSLLAEMPAGLTTVENLPQLLLEIRKKRATQRPPYPDARPTAPYPHAATSRPPASPGRAWERVDPGHSEPLDYPRYPWCSQKATDSPSRHHPPRPPPPPFSRGQGQLDRHGNPMQYSRFCVETVPVRVVDHGYREETPANYETPRSTYSTAHGTSRAGTSRSRNLPVSSQTADDYRYPVASATDFGRQNQDVPVVADKVALFSDTPTKKAALDFHGETPKTFPYTCSLCDITVLSEKFWSLHVNGTQHADGQLTLLQMYPKWDCRMQTAREGDDHSEIQRFEKQTVGPSHRPIHYFDKPSRSERKNKDTKTNANTTKGSGKVVCARFPAQFLNEDGLRNLIKQFGEVVKIIMFPALAFVEMGSTDQANDLVKYYLDNPALVKEGQVTFSVSSTFNFLQSSKVLRFSPVLTGKESATWKTELLAVAKCFGSVEHSLFLPTQAFVEMTNSVDARKLVEHHTTQPLKIDGLHIKVAFSSEYNTLRTISIRKSSDRMSPDRNRKSEDRSSRRRTPSPRKRSLSLNRDCSTSPKRRRTCRERDTSRHKERAISSGGGKSRSKSPTKHGGRRSYRSTTFHTKEKTPVETACPHLRGTKDKTPPQSSAVLRRTNKAVDNTRQRKRDAEDSSEEGGFQPCEMDSDIEGMEVIGEDGDIEGMAVYGEDGEENIEEEERPETPTNETDAHEAEEKEIVAHKEEGVQEVQEAAEEVQEAAEEVQEAAEEVQEAAEEVQEAAEEVLEAQEEVQKAQEEVHKEEENKQVHKEPLRDTPKGLRPHVALCPAERELELRAMDLIEEVEAIYEPEQKTTSSSKDGAPTEVLSERGCERGGANQDGEASFDEEEPDFPEDLDNLVTLDELEDMSSNDDQDNPSTGENKSKNMISRSRPRSGRVIYIRNLPRGPYTDADFVEIFTGYGKVHRYFLLRNREEGFVEMDRSYDAARAIKDVRLNGYKFHGQKLVFLQSRKYEKLTTGWKPESDSDSNSDRRKECSRGGSRRSERMSSHSKSAAKDEKRTDGGGKKSNKDTKKKDDEKRDNGITKERKKECDKTKYSPEMSKERCALSAEPGDQGDEENGGMSKVNTDFCEDKKTKPEDEVETEPDSIISVESSFQPNNPVGREFIKPVVGYFCNLCKRIYADEDEAKNQHCSSLSHYQKFMERHGF